MAKGGVTVKIATDKVIALLEAKLKEMEEHKVNYDKLVAQENKAMSAWKKAAVDYAKKNFTKALESDVSLTYGSGNERTIKVTLFFSEKTAPARPKHTDIQRPDSYQFREDYDDITQALRLLKLTDQEYVSTATYRSVTRFL